jgi:hypothetical protein
MFKKFFSQLTIVIVVVVFSLTLGITSASATTLSFKTEGLTKKNRALTGQLVFSDEALQKAIREAPNQMGMNESIPISKIEGAKFHMKYIAPYSEVEHTEATLCGKEIYDINGFEEEPLTGGQEAMLVLSSGGQPSYIDFSSCVGQAGSVSSNISKLDSRVAFSTADALSGKLSVLDKDVMGNVIYKKIQPIKFTLSP